MKPTGYHNRSKIESSLPPVNQTVYRTLQILEQASKETTPTVNYKKDSADFEGDRLSSPDQDRIPRAAHCKILEQARKETNPSVNYKKEKFKPAREPNSMPHSGSTKQRDESKHE